MQNNTSLKLSPYFFISNLDDKTDIATNLATGEVVKLTKEERQELIGIVKKGKVAAIKRRHAEILLKADEDRKGKAWNDGKIDATPMFLDQN